MSTSNKYEISPFHGITEMNCLLKDKPTSINMFMYDSAHDDHTFIFISGILNGNYPSNTSYCHDKSLA